MIALRALLICTMATLALNTQLAGLPSPGTPAVRPVSAAQTNREGAPPEVMALLPEDTHVHAAIVADITGTGHPHLVVLSDLPSQTEGRHNEALIVADHVTVFASAPTGWRLVQDMAFPNHVARGFRAVTPIRAEVLDLDGIQALVLVMPTGAHGARLTIVRWDGSDFVLVFDGATADGGGPGVARQGQLANAIPWTGSALGVQGLLVDDLDGDAIPEIVQREPSYCVYNWAGPPRLLTVHRWNGATYAPTTSRYPALLAEAEAEAQAVLDDVVAGRTPIGTPPANEGAACLREVFAALASAAGDHDRAVAACGRASALDPTPRSPRVASPCDVLLRWATYRDAEYDISFAYPRLWDRAGFEQCQARGDQSGLRLGSRIEIVVLPAPDRSLDEWVEEFITARTAPPYDWRIESVGRRLVGGQQATSFDYRFGGLNRAGTATAVARGGRMYVFAFTSGGSSCDLPAQHLTEGAVYSQMLMSLQFLDAEIEQEVVGPDLPHSGSGAVAVHSSSRLPDSPVRPALHRSTGTGPTVTGGQAVPLQVGPETELPEGIALIVELNCWQCDAPTAGLARVYRDARGQVRVESLFGWGGPGHLADVTLPTAGDVGAGYPYINGFALKGDGSEIVVAFCIRGYCGYHGIPSPDAQTGLLRSLDGGVTWTTWGVLDGRYEVFAITEDGAVLKSPYGPGPDPSTYTPAGFMLFPSGTPLSPPPQVVLQGPYMPSGQSTRPMVLSTGELAWPVAGGLVGTDGTVLLTLEGGREWAGIPGGIFDPDGELLVPVVRQGRRLSEAYALLVLNQGRTVTEFSLDGFAHIGGRLDSGLLVGNITLPREQLNRDPALLQRFAEDPEGWFIPISSPEVLSRNPSLPFVGYLPAMLDLDAGRAYPIAHPFLDRPLRNGSNHVLAVVQGPFARVINTGSCLNVRAEPSADARVLACVADGVLLRRAHETRDEADQAWLRLVTPRGEQGWASTTYLEYR